jgi:MFS family permease
MVAVERPPTRAWTVWSVGVGAYVVAVIQRTSLGVAGLDAAHRFGASAGALASFAVLQLLVYAALQIPVGAAVDRVGPRSLVAVGAVVMAVGQLTLAVTHSLPVAVAARVLVGAGDAMTFICVLRLVNTWFPPRRVPLVTQVTGLVGQFGQVLSTIPLVALLHGPGWTPAFASAAALSVIACVLVLVFVRDSPAGSPGVGGGPSFRDVLGGLRSAWQHPGTRLGLWAHFTTMFPAAVFGMLWGFPFLVSGERLSRQSAGVLLTVFVLASMACAPFLGVMVERHPLRRSWLVLGIVAVTATVWGVVLALSAPAPRWLLVVLVLVLALCGPGSMIGFDYARTFNPPNRLGTATGIVNVGGFVATLVTIMAVGVLLDLTDHGGAYTLQGFRWAMSAQFVVWGVGLTGFLRARRLVRARMAREGVVIPPFREVARRSQRARRVRTGGQGRGRSGS